MKVYVPSPPEQLFTGIGQVLHGLHTWLPSVDVEVVEKMADADVINTHIATIPKSDRPCVLSNHGLYWTAEMDWGEPGKAMNKQVFDALFQADVVTVPSLFVKKAVGRHTLIDAIVAHHGIDTDAWTPKPSRGYVLWNKARMDVSCLPDDMDALALRASNVPFISTFSRHKPDNVEELGRLSHAEMKPIIQRAGVYLATAKESGGPCFGVLEALASGVPVLSWNFGGTADAIDHLETGYLAEPGNVDDLVEGLHYCLEHRDRLSAACRATCVEKYQWKTVVQAYREAFERALIPHPVTVSVIITAYNLESYLARCIESVQAQTYTDWELIIVNDASTDLSGKIASSYVDHDERIIVLHNTANQHVSESRNLGHLVARGKYVLNLDADDALYPYALERLVKGLDEDRSIHVTTGPLMIESGKYAQLSDWPKDIHLDFQLNGSNQFPYCSLYRKSLWKNIGGFRRRIRTGIEDADFWTRMLSYGYRGRVVTGDPIIHYTVREGSLSKTHRTTASKWLSWFAWIEDRQKLPAGSGNVVKSFSPPLISVVIPVGPGHDSLIQTCVDSIISQTFEDWEVVIVNDTGTAWGDSHYLYGMPFATIVDSDENHGVAYARNRGIEAARGKYIVFVDVDDIAQPRMLEVLYLTHQQAGGWIYGDWYYVSKDGQLVHEVAQDWSPEGLVDKALGPISGLFERDDLLLIEGFDEEAPGWEDWDLCLNLLQHEIGGTRVEYPLIMYNMQHGWRREQNFSAGHKLIQYIRDKYKDLFGGNMPCCGKGGGRTRVVRSAAQKESPLGTKNDMVLVRYVGRELQTRRIKSRVQRGQTYVFNGRSRREFLVHREELDRFNSRDFEIVRQAAPEAQAGHEVVVLQTEAPPPTPVVVQPPPGEEQAEWPFEIGEVRHTDIASLGLPAAIETVLRNNDIVTIEHLELLGEAALLTLKGLGTTRVDTIKEKLAAWNDGS